MLLLICIYFDVDNFGCLILQVLIYYIKEVYEQVVFMDDVVCVQVFEDIYKFGEIVSLFIEVFFEVFISIIE